MASISASEYRANFEREMASKASDAAWQARNEEFRKRRENDPVRQMALEDDAREHKQDLEKQALANRGAFDVQSKQTEGVLGAQGLANKGNLDLAGIASNDRSLDRNADSFFKIANLQSGFSTEGRSPRFDTGSNGGLGGLDVPGASSNSGLPEAISGTLNRTTPAFDFNNTLKAVEGMNRNLDTGVGRVNPQTDFVVGRGGKQFNVDTSGVRAKWALQGSQDPLRQTGRMNNKSGGADNGYGDVNIKRTSPAIGNSRNAIQGASVKPEQLTTYDKSKLNRDRMENGSSTLVASPVIKDLPETFAEQTARRKLERPKKRWER